MSSNKNREIAIRVFEKIRSAFPSLKMEMTLDHSHVDINVDIPKQGGLNFDVNLNLQNIDELHLVAGAFWCEWFPCNKIDRENAYFEAVCGILSGKWRVLEHYLGKRAVKAELQRPENSGWKTVTTWGSLYFRMPWVKKELRVMQNVKSA